MPGRVWLALERLKHAVGASDEAICPRCRTAFAVMDAWGLQESQAHRSQGPFVLPETLWELRGRMDAGLMEELIAIQAAAAMATGLVSPAHRVIDPLPGAQGSPRVPDATTLSQAQKTPAN
jgi:hypothetical protein